MTHALNFKKKSPTTLTFIAGTYIGDFFVFNEEISIQSFDDLHLRQIIFKHMFNNIIAYLNDHTIASTNITSHLSKLHTVLQCLQVQIFVIKNYLFRSESK